MSALLILIGLCVHLHILETPFFAQVQAQKREASAPVAEAFRHNTPEILLRAGVRSTEQAPFYLFSVFVITYGVVALYLDKTPILNDITGAATVELFTIPTFGYLSDRVGRRAWYLVSCLIMLAFAFPYFMLMNTKSDALVIFAITVSLAVCHAWVYGPQAALIAERFGIQSRYSGASLRYQLAAPFAGGLAPIIALLLLNGEKQSCCPGTVKGYCSA